MAEHEKFHFKTLAELEQKLDDLGLTLPIEGDFSPLFTSLEVSKYRLPNRFVAHPMEGFDSDQNGTPGPLSFRRYQRYAAGGVGLIWFEATAVKAEARSNPHQFYIHPGNVKIYQKLVERTLQVAETEMQQRPLLLIQLTHSGRYSKPQNKPRPIIAHHSAVLDARHNLPPDYPLISDEELDALQTQYVEAAALAFEAGFDGIDLKSCHRYLVSELLASFTRENSRYGGSFENRTRFLLETLAKIHQRFPEKIISTRLNVFDAISYPYGFGVSPDDYHIPDLREPIELIRQLKASGIPFINITIGNPYFNPHFGRPYDFPLKNAKPPAEHPLEGIVRFTEITRTIQATFPDLPVIGTGFSWLRQFMPYVAAGVLKTGGAQLIGQGRGMFAYPDSIKDLKEKGAMNPRKVCVTCSACTQIMRDGKHTGCVVRDSEIYGPSYRQARQFAKDELLQEAQRCRDCLYPTCQEGCPAGVNIPGFIKAFAEGNIPVAYKHLAESNLLPEICAYICPADVQCEGGCVEKIFSNSSVRIRDIQRMVSHEARAQGLSRIHFPDQLTGRKVAVIGAGSAGLTCTASLLQRGHAVTIFDARAFPGGIVRSLLPEKRISFQNVDSEIQALFHNIPTSHLEWRLGFRMTEIANLDSIAPDFDAVFLGMGLSESMRMFESNPENVIDALEFLEKVKAGINFNIPNQVAVIGGGNTAMDAAVVAKNAGARDVYLIYRRSFAELPAWPAERDEALNLGVHFLILSQPVGYAADENGKVKAIRLGRTALGEPDASGRRRPILIPDAESELPVQMVIEAIGQKAPANLGKILPGIKINRNGLVETIADSRTTSRPGVFAGGDIINGGATAVQAVADGLRAAEEIHEFVTKK